VHIWQSATTTDGGLVSSGEFLVGFEQSLMAAAAVAAGVHYLPLGLYACCGVFVCDWAQRQ
jgi:hypothetical protein